MAKSPTNTASKITPPFGVILSNREFTSEKYRYGFNGMEKDDEVKGTGNSYDFGARLMDTRLGRWLSIDPMLKLFPWDTPYNFGGNRPISYIDINGEKLFIAITKYNEKYRKQIQAELQKLTDDKIKVTRKGEVKIKHKNENPTRPTGTNILREVIASDKKAVINQAFGDPNASPGQGGNYAKEENTENSVNGVGSNVNIFINSIPATVEGVDFNDIESPIYITLAHELAHARRILEGNSLGILIKDESGEYSKNEDGEIERIVLMEESTAYLNENLVRKENKEDLRMPFLVPKLKPLEAEPLKFIEIEDNMKLEPRK